MRTEPLSSADYRTELQRGFFQTVLDAGLVVATDGTRNSFIRGPEVVHELVNMMALVMHSSSECSTPQKTRLASDEIARRLRKKIAIVKQSDTSFLTIVDQSNPQ